MALQRATSLLHLVNNSTKCCGLTRRFLSSSKKEIKDSEQVTIMPMEQEKSVMSKQEQIAFDVRKEATIIVSEFEDVGICSGVPEEHRKNRLVRIYCPAKSAMQSGTNNVHHWQIEFETRDRWENPLMGWTSTGDPLSNTQVQFSTKDEAIKFCNKMGWRYYVQKPNINNPKPRSYGTNFSWNRRTKVSTK